MDKQKISLVVPCYFSQKSLAELTQRIDSSLPAGIYEKELILVNDGSDDGTWEEIQQLSQHYPWVRGINLMRNYGQHSALLVGINHAIYDITITLDDDLQHAPEEIPALLAALTPNVDVVYGVPDRVRHNALKRLGSKTVRWLLSSAFGNKMARHASAFRVFRTNLRAAFEHCPGDYIYIDGMLYWATTRFASVKISHQARKYGTTTESLWKGMAHAINMVTGFSVVPLHIASFLGFVLVLIGMAVFCGVLWNYFFGAGVVKGFTFTAAIIILFSGVQMFSLGIIGAYIARIHLRTTGKPAALIRETT